VSPRLVRLDAGIESLVRLIEETPLVFAEMLEQFGVRLQGEAHRVGLPRP